MQKIRLFYQLSGLLLVLIVTYLCVYNVDDACKDAALVFDGGTAIVVLGGGLTATEAQNEHVPQHVQLRIDKAYEVWKDLKLRHQKVCIITTSAGTPYKPNPVDDKDFPVTEATSSAKKLIKMGVPPDSVFEENISLDTLGNAYFLRAIHVEPARINKLIVVTNDWHMPRVRAIFEFVFSLPFIGTDASKRHVPVPPNTVCEFIPVEAGIKNKETLQVRTLKELKSLKGFRSNFLGGGRGGKGGGRGVKSFADLRVWMFSQHNAYSSARLAPGGPGAMDISPELLKTY